VGIAPDRAYGSFEEMVTCEKTRPDRIDAVAIVTPNFAHHAPAKAFLEAGFHVICDKPVTTSLATAIELAETVRATGMIFGLTHNYTGYPDGPASPRYGRCGRARQSASGAGGISAGLADSAA
jgi:predicted dehydrogenase